MKEVKATKRIKASQNQIDGTEDKAIVDGEALLALYSVIDETRRLFHRLKVAAEQVHRQGELSGGRRGILRDLDRLGPQTVPQMARARPVSRQHIQTLVNQLADEGYVEFIENPAHKRSHLVHLTSRGKDLVDEMNRRETGLLSKLQIGISEEDMQGAAKVLRAVRQLFEGNQWKQLLKTVNEKHKRKTPDGEKLRRRKIK